MAISIGKKIFIIYFLRVIYLFLGLMASPIGEKILKSAMANAMCCALVIPENFFGFSSLHLPFCSIRHGLSLLP
jgi:hypothetical protein